MYISFNRIVDALHNLDPSQKKLLFHILQEDFSPSPGHQKNPAPDLSGADRPGEGQTCIYCSSSLLRRTGHYRNQQRYYCKSCNRTFTDLTEPPRFREQLLDKWCQCLEYVMEGYSASQCAKMLNIDKETSYIWRHKMLQALTAAPDGGFPGIRAAAERSFGNTPL